MNLTNLFAASMAVALAGTAFAGDDDLAMKLNPGDKAPAIDVSHWLKGDAITEFEEGKVYVVEFWATWCGPCKASMPHISELQTKMKDYDVTVLGISDEKLQTVAGFLVQSDKEGKMWWDKIQYTLGTDPDKSVYKDYMNAAGQRGIPTSFVVGKDGHVEWIGHPMNLDDVLEDVVHDRWDRDAFATEWKESMASEAKAMKIFQKLEEASNAQDWDALQNAFDEVIALGDRYEGYKAQKFVVYLTKQNDPKQGYAYGEKLAKEYWDEAMMLNQLAWYTVDTEGVETRNLEFALKLAKRANELTNDSDGAVQDTLARVYYEMGDLDKAIATQKKAVENATENFLPDLKAALEKYEQAAKSAKK